MVQCSAASFSRGPLCDNPTCQQLSVAIHPFGATSSVGEADIDCWNIVLEKYQCAGYDPNTVTLLLNSWRSTTKAGYATYLKQWIDFAVTNDLSIINPRTHEALKFLTDLYTKGYSYHQINTARSILSALLNLVNSISWGLTPIVRRFMKGVFGARPYFPKYDTTWDVSQVFNSFRSLPPVHQLDLKTLSKKLCMLLILLSGGQRCQTVHAIDITDLQVVGLLFLL